MNNPKNKDKSDTGNIDSTKDASWKTKFWSTSDRPGKKIIRVLKRLWKRFLVQSILIKWITLILIILTLAVGILFFSTFILWKLFSFVIFQVIINGLDWYLGVTENKTTTKNSKF